MPQINTSCFSNEYKASDRSNQRKSLLHPLDVKFDGQSDMVLPFIKAVAHRVNESGMNGDFLFYIKENPHPPIMDPKDKASFTAWLTSPARYEYGNLLDDTSQATIETVKLARDNVRRCVNQMTVLPSDPLSLDALALVSYQNRQCIYTMLVGAWSDEVKIIMSKYLEVHQNDGVTLFFLFCQHYAGTTTEHLIEAYSQLTEFKVQLPLFNGDVTKFTAYCRKPFRRLIASNADITIYDFMKVYQGCIDCDNVEFQAWVIAKYSEFRAGGAAHSWSILELLDRLDLEYTRIYSLGRWERGKNPEILALTAQVSKLQSQLSNMTPAVSSSRSSDSRPGNIKSLKPPNPPKEGGSEVCDYNGKTWKFCKTCFSDRGGNWNQTHTSSEHKAKSPIVRSTPPRRDPPSSTIANANFASNEDSSDLPTDFI